MTIKNKLVRAQNILHILSGALRRLIVDNLRAFILALSPKPLALFSWVRAYSAHLVKNLVYSRHSLNKTSYFIYARACAPLCILLLPAVLCLLPAGHLRAELGSSGTVAGLTLDDRAGSRHGWLVYPNLGLLRISTNNA
ncbi:MAG: hypothetical protein HY747_07570, partial [Elusimicrobia bacterium]|nr:hypothetical protein [Elusimicrobiota bacterium]